MAYTQEWKAVTSHWGHPGATDVSTVPLMEPGTRAQFAERGTAALGRAEFIYLRGVTGCQPGSWVTYSADNFATTLLAPNAKGQVAIALGAPTAAEYGWFLIFGKGVGLAATGFLDGADVYATAVPGTVDDAAVAGDRVKNVRGASAVGFPGLGTAEFSLNYPFMDDGVAA